MPPLPTRANIHPLPATESLLLLRRWWLVLRLWYTLKGPSASVLCIKQAAYLELQVVQWIILGAGMLHVRYALSVIVENELRMSECA